MFRGPKLACARSLKPAVHTSFAPPNQCSPWTPPIDEPAANERLEVLGWADTKAACGGGGPGAADTAPSSARLAISASRTAAAAAAAAAPAAGACAVRVCACACARVLAEDMARARETRTKDDAVSSSGVSGAE